jgi:hypothetical protein
MQPLTVYVMQQNLQRVLSTIATLPSDVQSQVNDESLRRLTQRNWGFDFYLLPTILEYAKWLEYSDEGSNYTYPLKNLHHLKGWLSCVTGASVKEAECVVEEILDDDFLVDILVRVCLQHGMNDSASRFQKQRASVYGRRIGWYGVVRIKKPRLVIETGIDRGLGSAILCRALMRNTEDGYSGRYLGTDINPSAGFLLADPLSQFGSIAYGDSIETLKTLSSEIDVFINDSDHSADYEAREYDAIMNKLSKDAVILGDNSHVTDKLFQFALRINRNYLHFAEEPSDHWYPGAGIGAAF